MVDPLVVAERMKEARFRTAAARREAVSQALMAQLVSNVLGRVVHQTQWGRYETGDSEPPLDVIRATARVSGLAEAYIAAFGEDMPAQSPPAQGSADPLSQAIAATANAPRGAKLEPKDVPAPRPGTKQQAEEKKKGKRAG
jgi:hypothetical protein